MFAFCKYDKDGSGIGPTQFGLARRYIINEKELEFESKVEKFGNLADELYEENERLKKDNKTQKTMIEIMSEILTEQ